MKTKANSHDGTLPESIATQNLFHFKRVAFHRAAISLTAAILDSWAVAVTSPPTNFSISVADSPGAMSPCDTCRINGTLFFGSFFFCCLLFAFAFPDTDDDFGSDICNAREVNDGFWRVTVRLPTACQFVHYSLNWLRKSKWPNAL
jgi:hypothetical protein